MEGPLNYLDSMARWVVLNEHTLGVIFNAQPDTLDVIHGSVLRGGHDWKNGPVRISPSDSVRPAAQADFDFFRVQAPPDLEFFHPGPATSPQQEEEEDMKFVTMQYADVATHYLPESDLPKLETAPCHLAEVTGRTLPGDIQKGEYGSIFWVPTDKLGWETFETEARVFGMSDRFIAIMREAHLQKIPYLRFDTDGNEIEGLAPVEEYAEI